jgi:hypothetical protein
VDDTDTVDDDSGGTPRSRRSTERIVAELDPEVELLPDIPIGGVDGDLFQRLPVAQRLVELATAGPVDAPRVVALHGTAGAGKSSLLRMASELMVAQGDVAVVTIDGAGYASAQGLATSIVNELTQFFSSAGVVDTSDKIRDALAGYGGIVSNIARIAGVKVDVEGALRRSPEALREEIAEMTQEVGKRIVMVVDHIDRLPPIELSGLLAALRFYTLIPYVAIVIAIDRRAVSLRLARTPGADPVALERLIQVEIALPPPDRVLLARVMAGGLARVGERIGRNLDPAFELLDPDGGLALELIETPRDAKRAINAITAALPLLGPGADLYDECLELVVRLLVPEIDGTRLDARRRMVGPALEHLFQELTGRLAGHRRGPAARAALRELIAAHDD